MTSPSVDPARPSVQDFAAEVWTPGQRLGALWTLLGSGLSLGGVGLFAAIYAVRHGSGSVALHGAEALAALAGVLGLTLASMVLHELVHGWTMHRFGARPRYGVALVGRLLPAFYCTAPGHRFTRGEYLQVALSPVVALSALGALGVVLAPVGGWLVVPLGLHLGGAIGDLWVSVLVARQPRCTLIEDTRTGIILYRLP